MEQTGSKLSCSSGKLGRLYKYRQPEHPTWSGSSASSRQFMAEVGAKPGTMFCSVFLIPPMYQLSGFLHTGWLEHLIFGYIPSRLDRNICEDSLPLLTSHASATDNFVKKKASWFVGNGWFKCLGVDAEKVGCLQLIVHRL